MKKISILLIMMLLLTLCGNITPVMADTPSFSGNGYGTEANPYKIATWEQLAWMRYALDDSDVYFELVNDLNASTDGYGSNASDAANGKGWVPIGNQDNKFTGHFDGNDYTISDLVINRPDEDYIGLFGYLNFTAVIQNIRLENISVTGQHYVGGLIGKIEAGTIINSSVNGSIIGNNFTGGLIGQTYGNPGMGGTTINNTYAIGAVEGANYVGGLIGNTDYATITDCYTKVNVLGNESTGGLVGYAQGTAFENSYALETVEGTINVGGLIGQTESSSGKVPQVIKCYATGDITGNGDNVGGLIGNIVGGASSNVSYSYATGNVTGSGNFTGGLIGQAISTIQINNSYAIGNVIGTSYVGGFIGGLANSCSVMNCYSIGYIEGDSNVGGFLGLPMGLPTITNSYYDSETSTFSDTGKGEPKTTLEMKDKTTFIDWDFSEGGDWNIVEGTTKCSYPYLTWMTEVTGWTESKAPGYESEGDDGGSSDGDSSRSRSSSNSSSSNTASVLINGNTQEGGTTSTQTHNNGQTIYTVTLDTEKMTNAIKKECTVTIQKNGNVDGVESVLDAELVKLMERNNVVIEIKTDIATYTLPSKQINIDNIISQFPEGTNPSDIKITIEVKSAGTGDVKMVENAAEEGGFSIIVPPIEFTVTATYGDKSVEVNSFNSYVERMVALPIGIDPSKITTAIVTDLDGTVRHVPTQIVIIDGKYYAKINSMTNSTYTVIYNPVEFIDVQDHWAKEAINDMGSRIIINGVDGKNYEPDKNISRAEFSAIIIKALGLPEGKGITGFKDIKQEEWYSGYVKTANTYGIVNGLSSTSFGPKDMITREQAMTMIARVMELTNIKPEITDNEITKFLSVYSDKAKISDYAKNSLVACLKAGIINGRTETTINPGEYITRAEAAVIVERVLKKSALI